MNHKQNYDPYFYNNNGFHGSYLAELMHKMSLFNYDDHDQEDPDVLPNQNQNPNPNPNPIRSAPPISYATSPSVNRYLYQSTSPVIEDDYFGLYSQNQYTSSPVNYATNQFEWPAYGNGIGMGTGMDMGTGMSNYYCYDHSPSASSSSSSSNNNNNNNGYNLHLSETQLQAAGLVYPSNRGRNWDNNENSYRTSQIVLDYFFAVDPCNVMINPLTYHVLKKLLNDDNKKLITAILRKIMEIPDDRLSYVCRHGVGIEFIKKLIVVGKKHPRIKELPKKLACVFSELMNDKYGRYAIKECCRQLDAYKNEPLYGKAIKLWKEMAYDKYGCTTLQQCIKSMSPVAGHYAPLSKMDLLIAIKDNAASLAVSRYGIYVLQHVSPMNIEAYDKEIVEQLKPHLETLCMQKSGSYLVEKYVFTPFMSIIAEELLKGGEFQLLRIAASMTGNYVIQDLLIETKTHDASLYERLSMILLEKLAELEYSPYGRNVAKVLRDQTMGWKSGTSHLSLVS